MTYSISIQKLFYCGIAIGIFLFSSDSNQIVFDHALKMPYTYSKHALNDTIAAI